MRTARARVRSSLRLLVIAPKPYKSRHRVGQTERNEKEGETKPHVESRGIVLIVIQKMPEYVYIARAVRALPTGIPKPAAMAVVS